MSVGVEAVYKIIITTPTNPPIANMYGLPRSEIPAFVVVDAEAVVAAAAEVGGGGADDVETLSTLPTVGTGTSLAVGAALGIRFIAETAPSLLAAF